MNGEPSKTVRFIVTFVLIPVVTGFTGALLVAAFLSLVISLLDTVPDLPAPVPFLSPLIGALLAGACILRFVPDAGGEGTPSYIAAVNRGDGRLSVRATLLKFPATLLTLGLYGSGGVVGPLARMGAGIGNSVTGGVLRAFGIIDRDILRTAAVCGVSGAVSSIFHSPLGGALFAAEVLRRESMKYTDLLPSALTGGTAFLVSSYLLHQRSVFAIDHAAIHMSGPSLWWLLPAAVFAGAVGMFFILVFEKVTKLLHRLCRTQPGRALIGGAVASIVWLLHGRQVLGISMSLYRHLTTGDLQALTVPSMLHQNAVLLIAVVIVGKTMATSFTVGSGMSGGFTGPMLILGTGSGALLSVVAGIGPGTPEYSGIVACCTAAMLSAVMNIPLAAIILTADLFGYNCILPATIGGAVAFLVYRRRTIYGYLAAPYMENGDNHP